MAPAGFANGGFVNDESTPQDNNNEVKDQPVALWDSFRTVTNSNNDTFAVQEQIFTWLRIIAKIAISVLCFLLVLATGVMSKITTILVTSGMGYSSNCICDGGLRCHNFSLCTAVNSNSSKREQRLYYQSTVSWTWSLILIICFPYTVVFIKNLWNSLSCSKSNWTGCRVLLLQLLLETLHSIGVILFLTQALANLGITQSIGLFLGLGIVPSLIRILNSEKDRGCRQVFIVLNSVSFIIQLSALVMFPIERMISKGEAIDIKQIGWHLSALLMSIRWWPNFFNKNSAIKLAIVKDNESSNLKKKKTLYRQLITQSNGYLQTIVYSWKIVLTIFGVILSMSVRTEVPFTEFLNLRQFIEGDKDENVLRAHYPLFISLINICSGIFCYYLLLHGVKSKLPAFVYCVPLTLLSPVTVATTVTLNPEISGWSSNLFYQYIQQKILNDFGHSSPAIFWGVTCSSMALYLISQVYICQHIWIKPRRKIERTERLFFVAMYDGECIEQSLFYNRRPEKKKRRTTQRISNAQNMSANDHCDSINRMENWRDPNVTQIYFCATMWHENQQEMLMLLKSVLRMDLDHFKKSSTKSYVGTDDFYNFETHIFFDDAYEDHKENQTEYRVNEYVRQLVEAVPMAVRDFFTKLNIEIKDPIKIPTPYGGRLEWKLPSGNMMIAHLKDKAKIRHKKRWSQVMYMYYLLGEKLINNQAFSDREKIKAGMNTYVLALDGDVDFKPEAVHLLVDMMKKDPSVGAACGRIHPLGSGPIVWYQKFEYAIAHWLQKATEHVLGCVLCSPGCFSLFRAEALMSDNVMAKYATTSTKAIHYLQYDQGEDRWLCTLLLQAGYKVEYNAASDALTFAPEGFDEFFNQRRRWGPSTMANILDLILDCWNVIRINKHMSLLYVLYHGTQFFASIVGPGTIFLMITGALQLALEPIFGRTIWPAFFLNLIPIALFTAVSFFVESKTQLKMAKIYTIFYGLVMCMVIISVVIQLRSSWCSPSSTFFFIVTGSFVVSAILHPQECASVIYGLVYFILIPCMYMLLIIYSFININNVSWGTREVVPTPSQQKENAEKQAQEKEKQKKGVLGFLSSMWSITGNDGDDADGNTLSCGSACRIVCCPSSKKDQRNEEYWQINKKLDRLQEIVYDALLKRSVREENEPGKINHDEEEESRDTFDSNKSFPSFRRPSANFRPDSMSLTKAAEVILRDDMVNPFWIEDTKLGSGEIKFTDEKENGFWRLFIEKYLKPLDNNKANKEKVEQQLLELRQNVNFGFFLANATFIVVIMTLQANTDYLSLSWPCQSDKPPIGKVNKAASDIQVEPLGLMFLIYFMFILGLQFIGMIFHRLGTFWHILASTSLKDATDDKAKLVEEIINLTMEGDEQSDTEDTESVFSAFGSDDSENSPRNPAFRKSFRTTKKLLERGLTVSKPMTTLQEAIQPSLEVIESNEEENLEKRFRKMSRNQRRQTITELKISKGQLVKRYRAYSENTDSKV